MSNCTVNNCKHTVQPWATSQFPDPQVGGSSNPMCASTLSGVGVTEEKRTQVMKDCKGGNSCFSNLNAIEAEPETLFTNLMDKGWGDKDTSGSVLNTINHASPENLRDQLKFELCRRAACIPKDAVGEQTGWDYWSTFVQGTWINKLLYSFAIVPTIWVVGSILIKPLLLNANNIPTVLSGMGNTRKSITSVSIYFVGTVLLGLFMYLIFGKYNLATSFFMLIIMFSIFVPTISKKDNTAFAIITAFFKLIPIAYVIWMFAKESGDWAKSNTIENASESGIYNGVLYIIMAVIFAFFAFFASKEAAAGSDASKALRLPYLIMLGLCIVAAAVLFILGATGSNDKTDRKNTTHVVWQVIINAVFYLVLVVLGGTTENNSAYVIASIVVGLIVFNIVDMSNMLEAVAPSVSLTGITVAIAIFTTIVVPLFIKHNGSGFTMQQAIGAASFFSTYCGISGIHTFLTVYIPPLVLSLLVFERIINSVLLKLNNVAGGRYSVRGITFSRNPLNKNNWTFLFTGPIMAKAFNALMNHMDVPAAKQFKPDFGVGVPNRYTFPRE